MGRTQPTAAKVAALVFAAAACAPENPGDNARPADEGVVEMPAGKASAITATGDPAAAIEKLRTLYAELEAFKGEAKFHEVEFGRCCIYWRWKQKVDTISENEGRRILTKAGFAPGDLVQLASRYARSRGRETDLTRHLKGRIENGLNPTTASGGNGVLRTSGRWCTDVEVFADFVKGMESGDMNLAYRPETDPSCREYAPGTKVGPVLAAKQFHFSDGTPFLRFVQVRAPDSRRIWVSDREVDF